MRFSPFLVPPGHVHGFSPGRNRLCKADITGQMGQSPSPASSSTPPAISTARPGQAALVVWVQFSSSGLSAHVRILHVQDGSIMRNRNLSFVFLTAAIVAVSVLGAATRSMAQTEKVLYSFGNGTDGSQPEGDLVFDAAGNAYITTYAGGAYGLGSVCKLMPKANGHWTEQVLYSFG